MLSLSPSLIFWATLIVNLALVACVLALLLGPAQQAQFSAEVVTEVAQIDVPAGAIAPRGLINQASGRTKDACGWELELYEPVARPLSLVFTSEGGQPSLLVKAAEQPTLPMGVRRDCAGDEAEVTGSVRLRPFSLDGGESIVVEGAVTLGQVPGANGGLLQGGKVTASSSSWPSRSARVSSTSELMLGDRLRFFDTSRGDNLALTSAVIRFEPEKKALRVVAHTGAARAEVTRIGTDQSFPITVAPTFFARLQAQSEWAVLLLSLGLILNVTSAVRHYAGSEATQRVKAVE